MWKANRYRTVIHYIAPLQLGLYHSAPDSSMVKRNSFQVITMAHCLTYSLSVYMCSLSSVHFQFIVTLSVIHVQTTGIIQYTVAQLKRNSTLKYYNHNDTTLIFP